MGVIHDLAAQLARALKDSPENRTYHEARRRLAADGGLEKRLADFRVKQWEASALSMQGTPLPPDQLKALEQMFHSLQAAPTAKAFLQAEHQLGQLWSELQRLLASSIDPSITGSGRPGAGSGK